MERTRSRWTILVVAYLGMMSFGVAFHAVPPVLSLIIKELGLSHAQGGLLMSTFAFPGIVVGIIAGMLTDRYGIKTTGGTFLALMVLGTLLAAFSQSFGYLLLGRTLTGIGSMAIIVNLYRLVSQWFMGKELGLAMGIYSTAFPFATLLSFISFGYLGMTLTWRAPVWVSFGFAVFALLIFLLKCSEYEGDGESERAPFSFRGMVGIGLPIWLLALSWTCFESVITCFLTFAPDYFLGKGVSLAIASALPALVMPAGLILQPFVGWLLDRTEKKEYFIGAGGISIAVLMVVISGDYDSYLVPLILVGVFSALVPAPTFAFPPALVSPLYLGLAYGIIGSLSNVGRVIMPYLVGSARDYTGDYRTGFLMMAVLALGVTVSIAFVAIGRRREG